MMDSPLWLIIAPNDIWKIIRRKGPELEAPRDRKPRQHWSHEIFLWYVLSCDGKNSFKNSWTRIEIRISTTIE